MHARIIRAMMRKDALDFWLDKSKVAALLGPIFLAGLFFLIGHLVVSNPTRLLVYNPGHSSLQKVVSSNFASAQITQATSPAQVSAAFGATGAQQSAAYDLGLSIPVDFEQRLRAGDHPQVNVYFNGAAMNAQQREALQTVITNYARSVAAPNPPLSLATETINPGPPTSALSLSKFYSVLILPFSFSVGLTLMPGLLIEEKEKKTLRWLLVTPAALGDVLLAKVLVVLVYQLALSVLVLALLGGFAGNFPLLLLYTLFGACLALALGLLIGTVFQTASAAGAISGLAILIFILPAIVIPLAPLLANNPLTVLVRALPTYYIADGANNAVQRQGSFGSNLLDVGVILGSAILVFLLTARILRRQVSVTGAI